MPGWRRLRAARAGCVRPGGARGRRGAAWRCPGAPGGCVLRGSRSAEAPGAAPGKPPGGAWRPQSTAGLPRSGGGCWGCAVPAAPFPCVWGTKRAKKWFSGVVRRRLVSWHEALTVLWAVPGPLNVHKCTLSIAWTLGVGEAARFNPALLFCLRFPFSPSCQIRSCRVLDLLILEARKGFSPWLKEGQIQSLLL